MTNRPSITKFKRQQQLFKLASGCSINDVRPDSLGVADVAEQSFAVFKEFKAAGKFKADARFQVTIPGPLDLIIRIDASNEERFRLGERLCRNEIERILSRLPPDEITIQLDLAIEVAVEEYLRRRNDYDMPLYERLDWTLQEQAKVVARVCDAIPASVELGFHLCSLWHIDQSQGQDNNVHVDWCAALFREVKHPISYIHLPTIPEHNIEDFAPLDRLRFPPETKLFVGVIHTDDWIEGARRRIHAITPHYQNFGVASYCGLLQPSQKEHAHPHAVDDIFRLHLDVANVD